MKAKGATRRSPARAVCALVIIALLIWGVCPSLRLRLDILTSHRTKQASSAGRQRQAGMLSSRRCVLCCLAGFCIVPYFDAKSVSGSTLSAYRSSPIAKQHNPRLCAYGTAQGLRA